MKRRWIPPAAALLVLVVSVAPVSLGWASENTAIRATLVLVALSFGIMGVVFAAMRQRLGNVDQMTRFGATLADLVTTVAAIAFALCWVFGAALVFGLGADLTACRPRNGAIDANACLAAVQSSAMPGWMTIANRAVIAALATLAIGTGLAVLWEMRRALPDLAVHEPALPPHVAYERRRGPQTPLKGD